MAEPDFWIKRGDLGPPLVAFAQDVDRARMNIAGATIRFVMTPVAGGSAKVAAAASNLQVGTGSDGSRGKMQYTWQGTDTSVAGDFYGEFEVTTAGVPVTYPNGRHLLIRVREDLD